MSARGPIWLSTPMTPDEVNAMQHESSESPSRMRDNRRYDDDRHREWNSDSRCEYCGRFHENICDSQTKLSPSANGLRHERKKMEAIRQVPLGAAVEKATDLLPTSNESQNSDVQGLMLAEAEIDDVLLPVDCESRAMNTSRFVTPVEQDGKPVEQDPHAQMGEEIQYESINTKPDAKKSDVRPVKRPEGRCFRYVSVNDSDRLFDAQSQRDMSSPSLHHHFHLNRRPLMNARNLPDYGGRNYINRASDHSPFESPRSTEVDSALCRQTKTLDPRDVWGTAVHTSSSCETAFDPGPPHRPRDDKTPLPPPADAAEERHLHSATLLSGFMSMPDLTVINCFSPEVSNRVMLYKAEETPQTFN